MTILCTVTNDLNYDQRMQRICTSLVRHEYSVLLVGRVLPHSAPLEEQVFRQYRLHCRFRRGFLFYAEYNLRLFFFLMRASFDAVCSVDLDTLPAGCLASVLRRKKRLFDAHEYFTEVPEVTDRPVVKAFWEAVARLCLPFYRHAYTVGPALADIFEKKYHIPFGVVKNCPPNNTKKGGGGERFLLYQGALNAARGIEQMLEALRDLPDVELWLAGEGDLSAELRRLARELGVAERVKFLGYVKPAALKTLTQQAWLGINVLENKGLSYYYSLANKFFDYVQAGVPVLTMDFPEYRALNARHEVAILLERLSPEAVVAAVRYLQEHPEIYERLQRNTLHAREDWCWEKEEETLLACWSAVFAGQAVTAPR